METIWERDEHGVRWLSFRGCRFRFAETECTRELIDRIEELEAIVDKLPKDRQGKPIVPNTTRWYVHSRGHVRCVAVGSQLDFGWANSKAPGQPATVWRHIDESFDTREAAEAAKEK